MKDKPERTAWDINTVPAWEQQGCGVDPTDPDYADYQEAFERRNPPPSTQ